MERKTMKRIGKKLSEKIVGTLAAFAATTLVTGSAFAAAVFIPTQTEESPYANTSVCYVRNADIDVLRPVTKLLKGHAVKDGNAYLPKNARFVINNTAPIDTAKLNVGDSVDFVLAEDFTVNGKTVISKDTPLTGYVTEKKRRSISSGYGTLSIEVKEIVTDSGVSVPLHCRIHDRAKSYVYFPGATEFFASVAQDTDLGYSCETTNSKQYKTNAPSNMFF